jgi:hypothetical protein
MPLTARPLPQRSRSQGRPSGTALADLSLDGGESGGKAMGFLFGASYVGNRVFRVAFLFLVLFMVFCLYQMSKPLA